jgi:hypothetical protein
MATEMRQAASETQAQAQAQAQEEGQGGTTMTRTATRFILQARPRLATALRLAPAALLLVGVATMAPDASATSCAPSNLAVSGGTVDNRTNVRVTADGGTADADANGGDFNTAVGGNGGQNGDGGDAYAGNGGIALADASGGMIDLDDINSGNNRGNTVAVSAPRKCGGNLAVDGGTVRNETTIRLSANGGTATADANGGDFNTAVGGNGGENGDGGNALAGNGGIAVADASGGDISIGDINSGNNRGNTVLVETSGGLFGGGGNARISGGTVSNETTIRVSADGGTADADANGGDDNTAVGGNGGQNGDGGDAAAGNGGIAVADASGGAVTIGDVNSGYNSGNTVLVQGGQGGNLAVDGGTVTNETTIEVSANGGTATADANGGDFNSANGGNGGQNGDGGDAAAGNGGYAEADASGGNVTIGEINSGGNEGNTVIVGS